MLGQLSDGDTEVGGQERARVGSACVMLQQISGSLGLALSGEVRADEF